MPALADGEIVATLEALNQGEVDQATVAKKQAKDDKVKKFADHMTMDHSQWKKDVEDLAKKEKIDPKDAEITKTLKKDSETLVTKLEGTSDKTFDNVYIDAQVAGHQEALDLIDQRLFKDVKNDELKKAIATARGKIQGHLDEAKSIAGSIGSGATPSATPATSAAPTAKPK